MQIVLSSCVNQEVQQIFKRYLMRTNHAIDYAIKMDVKARMKGGAHICKFCTNGNQSIGMPSNIEKNFLQAF